jgi:hypothetical protein
LPIKKQVSFKAAGTEASVNKSFYLTILVLFNFFLSGCSSMPNLFGTDGIPASDPSSPDYHESYVAPAIDRQDIVLGMNTKDVLAAWGRPREVETAGDSSRGNERWLFYQSNSLRYGIEKAKIIYFENGRVVGWESPR